MSVLAFVAAFLVSAPAAASASAVVAVSCLDVDAGYYIPSNNSSNTTKQQ